MEKFYNIFLPKKYVDTLGLDNAFILYYIEGVLMDYSLILNDSFIGINSIRTLLTAEFPFFTEDKIEQAILYLTENDYLCQYDEGDVYYTLGFRSLNL